MRIWYRIPSIFKLPASKLKYTYDNIRKSETLVK